MGTTLSVCALPVGGIAGSAAIFPDILQKAANILKEAEGTLLTDSLVTHVADRLILLMVHEQGASSPMIRALKDAAIAAAKETAEKRRLYCRPAEQIVCGLSFAERDSEPFLLFLADTDSTAFWNPVLLSQFADPFTTPSLTEGRGFVFCTEDAAMYQTPQELHRLIPAAKTSAIVGIALDADTPAASAGAGTVLITRAETPYPSAAELCGIFTRPRISPDGVLCPVSLCDGRRLSPGIVPVVALGFSVACGKLSGPVDLFDNPAFDAARAAAGNLSRIL